MGRNRPSNEDAPRVPGEEGGRPWGRIVLGLLLLLALALLIPFACQALRGSGDGGSGNPGSAEKTAADGSGNGQSGAASGNGDGNAGEGATAPEEQGSSGDTETTTQDAAGDGGEQAGGAETGDTDARIADIGRTGSQDGRVVTIPRAEIPGTEGWIAVHADDGGEPGEVLGVAPLSAGENNDIEVELDRPLDSPQRLYAMLHKEGPADGDYTFPNGDQPVEENGEAVVEAFDYDLANAAADGTDSASGNGASTDQETVNGEGVEDRPLPDSGGGALAATVGGLALLAAGGLVRLRVSRTSL